MATPAATSGATTARAATRSRRRSSGAISFAPCIRATPGHRPRLQTYQGDADTTISYKNTGEAIKEWTNVLGLSMTPTSTDTGYKAADRDLQPPVLEERVRLHGLRGLDITRRHALDGVRGSRHAQVLRPQHARASPIRRRTAVAPVPVARAARPARADRPVRAARRAAAGPGRRRRCHGHRRRSGERRPWRHDGRGREQRQRGHDGRSRDQRQRRHHGRGRHGRQRRHRWRRERRYQRQRRNQRRRRLDWNRQRRWASGTGGVQGGGGSSARAGRKLRDRNRRHRNAGRHFFGRGRVRGRQQQSPGAPFLAWRLLLLVALGLVFRRQRRARSTCAPRTSKPGWIGSTRR